MNRVKDFFLKVNFKADTRYLTLINSLTLDFCLLSGFSEEQGKNVSLAVDEAVTNTIKHAYHFDSSKDVEVFLNFDGRKLVIKVYHTGVPLSPDNLVFPDMKEYLERYKKGGLGILLMIKFMDSVEYGKEKGKHFCKLVKEIEQA